MVVQFSLNENRKLILSVLLETGRINLGSLEKILAVFRSGEDSFWQLALAVEAKAVNRPELEDLCDGYFYRQRLTDRNGFQNDLAWLLSVGLIETNGDIDLYLIHEAVLTKEGERIANSIEQNRRLILRPKTEFQTSVFVACAFGYDEIDRLYHEHLAPACSSLGYNPVRVDMSEPVQTITDAIMKGISESSCTIADLTHARPSVYFEVGYAHGLGIPLLLTARRDHFHGIDDSARIHFDLAQYRISFWSINSDGQFQWDNSGMEPRNRLGALIPSRQKPTNSTVG